VKNTSKVFVVILLLAAAGLAWFFRGRGVEAETLFVRRGDVIRAVEEDGTVEAPDDRKIFAVQLARVSSVEVEAGDLVKKGQVLVRMQNADLGVRISETRTQINQAARDLEGARARVAKSRLQLADADRNRDRMGRLYKAGTVALVDLEQARLGSNRAREELADSLSAYASAAALSAGLRKTLGELDAKARELVAKSPMEGIILELPAEVEKVLLPGDLVVSVGPEGQMEIAADILSDALGGVAVGQVVRVTAPILGAAVLEGRVKKIYPRAEEKLSALGVLQRRVEVKVSLPYNPKLKPGFEVRVAIETARRSNVLLLPVESVRTTGEGRKIVFQVQEGRVRLTPVTLGIGDRRFVEVVSGLSEGSEVVKDASLDLREKDRVRK
jgi:HlyD family secretion protein